VRILEKLGYRVDVVGTGREAVEACARHAYAAVLMDNQMPELDGFAATQRIREQEGDSRHTPIIAMTASAMTGDRERCLAADMDDYVAKPVSPESLGEALRRQVRAPVAAAPPAPAPSAGDGPLDPTMLDQLLSIDERGTLLTEVIDTFLRIAPVRLTTLEKAARKKDAVALERTAHNFLGSCGNLGARRMAETCAALEAAARAGSADGAFGLVERLRAEFEEVKAALADRKEQVS
jgi:CheY-like chemotaxis protein/HPt (histidine-containing phosphotransfer) domain-containing protein